MVAFGRRRCVGSDAVKEHLQLELTLELNLGAATRCGTAGEFTTVRFRGWESGAGCAGSLKRAGLDAISLALSPSGEVERQIDEQE